MENKLTVDNKLLALLPAHALAILGINKPVNIRAARATNCKGLPRQETIQGCKHLGEVKGYRNRGVRQVIMSFYMDTCKESSSEVTSEDVAETFILTLTCLFLQPAEFTDLSSISSVPAGHDEMR